MHEAWLRPILGTLKGQKIQMYLLIMYCVTKVFERPRVKRGGGQGSYLVIHEMVKIKISSNIIMRRSRMLCQRGPNSDKFFLFGLFKLMRGEGI